jgi:hypothetical protein
MATNFHTDLSREMFIFGYRYYTSINTTFINLYVKMAIHE